MTPSDGQLFPGKFRGDQIKFLLPCQAPYEYGGVELDTADHSSTPRMVILTGITWRGGQVTMYAYGDEKCDSWYRLKPQKILTEKERLRGRS